MSFQRHPEAVLTFHNDGRTPWLSYSAWSAGRMVSGAAGPDRTVEMAAPGAPYRESNEDIDAALSAVRPWMVGGITNHPGNGVICELAVTDLESVMYALDRLARE